MCLLQGYIEDLDNMRGQFLCGYANETLSICQRHHVTCFETPLSGTHDFNGITLVLWLRNVQLHVETKDMVSSARIAIDDHMGRATYFVVARVTLRYVSCRLWQ